MRQPAVRCLEFVETVTDWMEGALADDDRVLLEEHLAICPHCTEYLEQLRAVQAVLLTMDRDTARESAPPAARAALLEALRRERRAGG